jgi:hypothetical protein
MIMSFFTGVYYLMLFGMLSQNLILLAIVFFIMMLCIFISFIFLSINFEFLFWEDRGVRNLSLKNLSAHQVRNRKTTLLYSTSLLFIVFLNVMMVIAMDLNLAMQYMEHRV